VSRKDVYDDRVLNMIPPIICHIFSDGKKWIPMFLDILPNGVVVIGLECILIEIRS